VPGRAVISDIVGYLRCPHCHRPLSLDGRTARCSNGHAFDVARQGYLSLLAPGALVRNADSAGMVAARLAFLAAGHYRFLARALAAAAAAALSRTATGTTAAGTTAARSTIAASPAAGAGATPAAGTDQSTVDGCVLDVGGGTGYHLAAVLEALPRLRGIALDISRPAALHAGRAHPRADAVVADAWQPLPVATGAAALALNVFSPRNGAELRRVLHPAGALLVTTPTNAHLQELIGPLSLLSVDRDKRTRLAGQLGDHFTGHRSQRHQRTMHLTHADVHALVEMGPNAHHRDREMLTYRISRLPEPCSVTASFQTVTYLPRL
jgi:23S rRNA (guanine745-N1)-methyltransferase